MFINNFILSSLLFLCLFQIFLVELPLIALSHTHIWYVKSSSDQPCPSTATCHQLSFYVQHASNFFQSDTTFKFMNGKHMLNFKLPIVIKNANNLILSGDDTDHTFPTIQCANGTFGFAFSHSSSIVINALRITNCGPSIHNSGITLTSIMTVKLTKITVEHTMGIGIKLLGVAKLVISNSTFVRNGLVNTKCSPESSKWEYSVHIIGGNLQQVEYNVSETKFFGNRQRGGGLFINTFSTVSSYVFVDECQFEGIIHCLEPAANISIHNYEEKAIVIVSNSSFSNNTVIGNTSEDGGALTIETTQSIYPAHHRFREPLNKIVISRSFFVYNIARGCAGLMIKLMSNKIKGILAIQQSHFLGNIASHDKGGGMCVMHWHHEKWSKSLHNLSIFKSVFEQNEAPDSAALFIVSLHRGYTLNIADCTFKSNKINNSMKVGGVIRIKLSKQTKALIAVLLSRCLFFKNQNGPSLIFDDYYNSVNDGGMQVKIAKSTFNSNYAPEYAQASAILAYFTFSSASMQIINCSFVSNRGASVISITHYAFILSAHPAVELINLNIESSTSMRDVVLLKCDSAALIIQIHNIVVHDNDATGLASLNCALQFSGHNIIANNTTPLGGGGLIVNGTGYAFTSVQSNIVFERNTAAFGGAVFSSAYPKTYDLQMPCTFQGLNASFIGNTATIAGDNLYGGYITGCYIMMPNYFLAYKNRNCKNLISKEAMQTKSSISSNPYHVFYCNINNNAVNYKMVIENISVFPGQSFELPIITVGYCNGISPGKLKILPSSGIHIETDEHSQYTSTTCKNLKYTPILLLARLSNASMAIQIQDAQLNSNSLTVNMFFLNCPHGMQLSRSSGICECDQTLASKSNSVHCNISNWPYPISKSSGKNIWIAYNKKSDCTIVVSDCPFYYCSLSSSVNFNLENTTDKQCAYNRRGTLCGQCREGLSLMLGSNACSKCNNRYLMLLLAFIIAGVLLVVFLIVLNMTVSVGSIHGLLFYANIVKLNETVFFPNGTIPVISHFISWLNLDLGFEVCFFNGLDGYWKTWLQFMFPFYVWLLALEITVSSKHSLKISRYLRSNIIAVLATLLLISFTKILRNVTNALMMTKLQCGKYQQFVWSIDGNINYLDPKHSIIVAFSMVVLISAVLYSSTIFLTQWLLHYSNKCCCRCNFLFRIQPFLDAYTGPYNNNHRYWTGLLLLIRLVLTFVFTYTSGSVNYVNNYVIIVFEVLIMFYLSILTSDIYRSRINYLYEKCFHFNLFILCSINSAVSQSEYKNYATIVSVAITMLLFILMIVQQIKQQCSRKPNSAVTVQEIQPLLANCADKNFHLNNEVICKRDPIIFDQ